jgi:osmotically inducible protein OsmC
LSDSRYNHQNRLIKGEAVMAKRTANAVWEGTLREGKGKVKLGSGAFEGQYSFASRFEEGTGTNPEELIGAAHAGCFSMALAAGLTKAGHNPTRISTNASVSLEKVGEGFKITTIELTTEGDVPGIDEKTFLDAAETAKKNCPVSQALAGVEINLKATLVKSAAA